MSTISNYTGHYLAGDYKIAIVASEFNASVVEKLCQDAQQNLVAQKINTITLIRVPGAFELPFAAQLAAVDHHAIIALGAIIRGETPHFDYICQVCAEGIMRVSLSTGVPIAFGVLTTNTLEQAIARAYGKHASPKGEHQSQGSGHYAAQVALRLARLQRQIKQGEPS